MIGATYGVNALNAGLDAPGVLIRLKYGRDGADDALKMQMLDRTTSERFTHAVLVSSDGGFSASVELLGQLGLFTTVIPGASRLSKKLRRAANEIAPRLGDIGAPGPDMA